MNEHDLKICVIIPAYNEEETIGSVVLRAKKYAGEIIVVDDGSADKTAEVAELAGAKVIKHELNKGKGTALKAGFKKAREFDPSIVVCLDSDGQHNPDEIPNLIASIINKKADIVIGSRFLEGTVNLPVYRRFGQKILDFITNLASRSNVSDSQSGFRAFSRNAMDKLKFREKGFDIESGILLEAKENNLKITEVPITVRYDIGKPSQHPLSHGMGVINSIVTIVSEKHPLMFFGVIGAAFIIAGLFSGYWVVLRYNEVNVLAVGTAMITLLLIILGIILILTGIILYAVHDIIRRYIKKE